ncbi:hypothetical protein CROQUDRAFT_668958 [Cronartium quercuum f. sp. fusiforme G11]|uniref:Uncharacterized protein n=1 Tax=Cronartium quercuum f. sp. fusiforme G11 TaxID=708437 RepID=A0A9P6NMH3_9BASI|nr:hypothetical protein CROQUDRAFT_668958 [Cronartium quercuum f. sp. fusiforme G11]
MYKTFFKPKTLIHAPDQAPFVPNANYHSATSPTHHRSVHNLRSVPDQPRGLRLVLASTIMSPNRRVISSRGTVFDMVHSFNPGLVNGGTSEPAGDTLIGEIVTDKKLHSAFLEKKRRRKVVLPPVSCELFWDLDHSILSQDLTTSDSSAVHGRRTTSSPPLTLFGPGVSSTVKLAHSESLRPQRLLFEGLPINGQPCPRRPSRKAVTEVASWNNLSKFTIPSRQFIGQEVTDDPNPIDTVQFGNALSVALEKYLNHLSQVEWNREESYWSASDLDPESDSEEEMVKL